MGQYTTNFNFALPAENEYYSVGVVNANTAAIDAAIMQRSRREYIVAAADSPAKMKKMADVICTATDAAQKIQTLINSAEDGEVIYFCKGTYNIYPGDESGIVINKRIRLIGSGNMTVLSHKGLSSDATRGGSIFRITKSDVLISDMMLVNHKEAVNAEAMIDIAYDGAEIRNVFFIQNTADGYTGYCIKNSANTNYVRIEGCRIFRDHYVSSMPMFEFGGYDFSGVIGSNISSGADGLIIRFKDTNSRNNTEIYACHGVNIL